MRFRYHIIYSTHRIDIQTIVRNTYWNWISLMSCLHAFISVCIILYRRFQDHSNTYLYVNYSMKTFRFSLTPRVRKTKSNTTTIMQHAHVCIYINMCYCSSHLLAYDFSIIIHRVHNPFVVHWLCANKNIFSTGHPRTAAYALYYIIILL